MMNHQAVYAAFDLYPSAKGAATHIYHMSGTLFDVFDGGLLYVLGNEKMPVFQGEGNIQIKRFSEPIPNYLQRAEKYTFSLFNELQEHPGLKICHFRDIWSGLAILQKDRSYKTIFEVNALSSVELPYKYDSIPEKTIEKIAKLELICLEGCDLIITPSIVIKNNLIIKGIGADKIRVLSNGADIPGSLPKPNGAPDHYLIYFGALQTWQGVDILLKSFAGLKDYEGLFLVICSSNRPQFSKPYLKLAEKLGIDNKIIWNYQLSKEELYAWIEHSLVSVVPLKDCSRNLEQGCSPIKIFESMACKTVVVSTDIPAVREIITDNVTGKLVRPGRPAEISRAIRFLLDNPVFRKKLATNAFDLIEKKYNWKIIRQQLKEIYLDFIKFEKNPISYE